MPAFCTVEKSLICTLRRIVQNTILVCHRIRVPVNTVVSHWVILKYIDN